MLGAICSRWKIVTRLGSNPGSFADRANTITELPGHLTNNFSPELYPGYINTSSELKGVLG